MMFLMKVRELKTYFLIQKSCWIRDRYAAYIHQLLQVQPTRARRSRHG